MNEYDDMASDKVEDVSTAIPLQSPAGKNARTSVTKSRAQLLPADTIHISDGFCGICRQILDKSRELNEEDMDSEIEFAHYSVLGMRKSAEKGCTLCGLFLGDAANFGYFELGIMEADEGDTMEAAPSNEESVHLQPTDSIESGIPIKKPPMYSDFRCFVIPIIQHRGVFFCLLLDGDGEAFSVIEFWPVLETGS